MVKIFNIFLIFSLFLFLSTSASASVRLNEIYPAPASGGLEWVELYNDETVEINLGEYTLTDLANNKIKIIDNIVPPLEFIIATCSSVLNNNGDTVFLKNVLGKILEIATYSGTFSPETSYGKCPDGNGNWFTSSLITKNSTNQSVCFLLTPTLEPTTLPTDDSLPTPTPTLTSTLTSTPTSIPTPSLILDIISYENIFISEAYVNPQIGENEWVEIYNANDYLVNLIDWYLDDLENAGSSPKLFTLTINPKSYAVFDLTSSMFNNDNDNVRLLDYNKNLKDSFEYNESEKGKSWGRISFDSDQFCQQSSSKNTVNNSCLNPTIEPINTISATGTKTVPTVHKSVPIFTKTQSVKLFTQQKSDSVIKINQQEVLGVSSKTKNKQNTNESLINLMSSISFSNSLLTITSIFLKIKIHEGI